MRAMLEQLHLDCRRFCFVDVGSGKGRALLLASDYPFREIIGVELSPELDRVARANIARYAGRGAISIDRRSSPCRVMRPSSTGRPARWSIYMWNAFTKPVMEQVFQNLKASLAQQPRELYLVYMHPELESMLAELPWLISFGGTSSP